MVPLRTEVLAARFLDVCTALEYRCAEPHTAPMQSHSLRGIFAMLAAVVSFSLMDVTMKRLVETYPAMQVTFLRGFASLPFLIGASALFGNWRKFAPVRWQLHLLRGFLSVATLWFFIYSVSVLSLADAYAIFM